MVVLQADDFIGQIVSSFISYERHIVSLQIPSTNFSRIYEYESRSFEYSWSYSWMVVLQADDFIGQVVSSFISYERHIVSLQIPSTNFSRIYEYESRPSVYSWSYSWMVVLQADDFIGQIVSSFISYERHIVSLQIPSTNFSRIYEYESRSFEYSWSYSWMVTQIPSTNFSRIYEYESRSFEYSWSYSWMVVLQADDFIGQIVSSFISYERHIVSLQIPSTNTSTGSAQVFREHSNTRVVHSSIRGLIRGW
ncbi:MAG: hypothetical protein KPEEDBHJ_03302 [Anaerolineales bacterium]|nr:hypothetical protein [Anaerolineales bacterium]